ncbi:hypothetical protein [Amycolatopsis australiensis]|uniref:Uncharacterized protein n=1 Tax=Amycolatopsis australiensis TaxID=546364 RepID=A0A1K1T6G0_9PSEU|nr:hypothetical protein [Amycolatopsis australiensis]SFW92209.1 hypothetical protein SAMN04489730_8461 [Amycolatopsis australiensis]
MTIRPFRWDLVRPDQVGTLLDRTPPPRLWFLPDLTVCAAKVLARCGDGELHFVGRSLDSMHDLLGGALERTSWHDRLHRLPLSLKPREAFGRRETRLLREHLAEGGITPHSLARGTRSTVFVDLVFEGDTFTELYYQLRQWIDDEREAWQVIRRKLRFLGVTLRQPTRPGAWRWQEDVAWTRELPASAVRNVSLARDVWYYFADDQPKVTPSFPRQRWTDETVTVPGHGKPVRRALAEAFALVDAGRSAAVRDRLVRTISGEPAIAGPWLRALVTELR